MSRNLTVAVVGLRFGTEFVPIYRDHPDVSHVVICDSDEALLDEVGDRHGIRDRVRSVDELLERPDVDAVHLITPLGAHGSGATAVMNRGKHCASTVPMGLDMQELHDLVDLERSSGKNYMMMETAVFTREFLHVKELYSAGEFGTITFARGAHYQDMEHWPAYWHGLPPMWYMTHAIAPVLALLGTRATSVRCLGSGSLPEARRQAYGNPFPAETAIFELADSDVAVEVSRTLFQSMRTYTESFAVYGERRGFEWPQIEDEAPMHYTLTEEADGTRRRSIIGERIEAPDRSDLLPAEIAKYTRECVLKDGSHLSFVQGGGHGGSHPHLVHEFVRSIIEKRPAVVNATTAANWTAAGLAAHESALLGGVPVAIPEFGGPRVSRGDDLRFAE